ncbi:hypothetical protein TNCV_381091 [Trichonephila clavipes]|uniref:Uncharacterized protein n=1 Tax=Trichonephila clavipes TaxID=2585209 RepID=A0A8X6S9Z5_TRICX|nr:hypothetical protein TNCV_381091 [Trichonephila clavipes]
MGYIFQNLATMFLPVFSRNVASILRMKPAKVADVPNKLLEALLLALKQEADALGKPQQDNNASGKAPDRDAFAFAGSAFW